MNKRTRNSVIIAAVILLVIALVWKIVLSGTSLTKKIADSLSQHGCRIHPDDLEKLMHEKNTSIKALMPENTVPESVIEASKKAGFDSDTERTGEIYVLLAELNGGKQVLTVFVVDGEIELAFIQVPDSDRVFPVNEYSFSK